MKLGIFKALAQRDFYFFNLGCVNGKACPKSAFVPSVLQLLRAAADIIPVIIVKSRFYAVAQLVYILAERVYLV